MAITKEVKIVVKETGLDEVNKKVNKLETSVSSLDDQQQSLQKSMGNSSQSVLDNGDAMGLLNDATGGLAMTVKDAVEASWLFAKSQKAASIMTAIQTTVIGTSTGAMKAFRIALAATGIGLIVIGLGLLVANFDKVKKAVLNVVPGLAVVGDMIMGIVEAVTDFIGVTSKADREAERVKNNALKRSKELDKRLKEDGSRYSESAKKKMAIEKQLQDDIADGKYNEVKLRKEAAFAIAQIDKDNAEKAAKIEKDKQDKLNDIAKTSSDKRKSDRLKAEEDEKKRLEDEKKRLEDIAKTKLDADMQSAKDAIAILDELKKNVETPAQKEQREFDEKKAVLEANNLSIEELEKQHRQNIFNISEEDRKNKLEEEKKFNDNLLQAEESLKSAKLEAANFTASLITQLAGKNKAVAIAMLAVEKGLAIAQIVSGAGKAIANASANLAAVPAVIGVVPNPLYAVQVAATVKGIAATKISAATSIASILAQTITSAKGLSSGGDGGGSGGGQAPQAPSFNLVQGTGRNQIAEGLNKQSVVKAYVVPTDVSTGQSMDRNIVKSASL